MKSFRPSSCRSIEGLTKVWDPQGGPPDPEELEDLDGGIDSGLLEEDCSERKSWRSCAEPIRGPTLGSSVGAGSFSVLGS